MNLRPVSLKEANDLVARFHRHSKPRQFHKFSIGLEKDGQLVGAAIIGRPNARHLDDGYTAEILRVVTDGTTNACSMLYGASVRACKAMGYRRIITYTLASETGASLRAANFKKTGETKAQQWSVPSRPRQLQIIHDRIRWEA